MELLVIEIDLLVLHLYNLYHTSSKIIAENVRPMGYFANAGNFSKSSLPDDHVLNPVSSICQLSIWLSPQQLIISLLCFK